VRSSKNSSLASVLIAASLAIVAAASPQSAFAQPASASAKPSPAAIKKATDAFKEGTKLFGQKKFALALEQFRLSYDTVASPNSRLYVARCQAEMGNLREAYTTFEGVIEEAQERGKTEPKYIATGEGAKRDLDELSKKLVLVTISVPNAPDSARVKVGGVPVPKENWDKPIPVDPGSVDVVLEVQGAPPVTEHADLKAGDTKTFTLQPAVVDTNPHPIEPPKTDDGSGGGSGLLIGGLVASGIGVAGFVMFGVEGGMATGTQGDLDTLCPSGCSASNAEAKDLVDQGKTQQLVANIGLVIGAVGIATGATLIVIDLATADGGGDAPTSDAALKLDVGAGHVGLRGTF